MENTPTPALKTNAENPNEDAVLRYLAANHPDDEAALTQLTALLEGDHTDDAFLDTLFKGMRLDEMMAKAEAEAYLRGKNDGIATQRRLLDTEPSSDTAPDDNTDSPAILRFMRHSVWD